jgi:hypothetical protein
MVAGTLLTYSVAVEAIDMAAKQHTVFQCHVVHTDRTFALLVHVGFFGPQINGREGIGLALGHANHTGHQHRIIWIAWSDGIATIGLDCRDGFVIDLHAAIDAIQQLQQRPQGIGICSTRYCISGQSVGTCAVAWLSAHRWRVIKQCPIPDSTAASINNCSFWRMSRMLPRFICNRVSCELVRLSPDCARSRAL